MSSIEASIKSKVEEAYSPFLLEIVNESDNHSGPKGRESHFKVLIISDHFKGKARIEKQREVLALLDDELKNGVHALSLRILSLDEAHKKGFQTPDCAHTKK